MALQPELTFTAVAAIDFGTARSGYGFAFSATPEEIICPTDWVGGQGLDVKALTNILLNKTTKKYTHFGYEALEEYLEQCDDGNADLFFETFKMSLYKKDGVQDKLTSSCGTEIDSHIVFREALAYMKDQVLGKINAAAISEKVEARDIMWVVTVPGMWQDKAKAIMRKAAEEAGMGPHNLILALEPEAASFHVRSELKEADVPVGCKYIVVDCGGGTVDFACHEVRENGIKETHPATGGPWGSTFINKGFVSLLCDIFTEEKIWNFQHKNPSTWLKFMSDWENTKIRVTDFKKRGKRISPPNSLFRYLGEIDGITRKCKEYSNSPKARQLDQTITFSLDGGFKLSGGTMRSLFMPLLEEISNKLDELSRSKEVKDSTHLFVVGGFAASNVLQSHLKSKFPQFECVTPLKPALSVINGAVRYGLEPSVVTARQSPHTYGIRIGSLFVEGVHPASNKVIDDDGEEWCNNMFQLFVSESQTIGFNECFSHTIPFRKGAISTALFYYTSPDRNPKYITDDCKKIGKLSVPIPLQIRDSERTDREMVCNMTFGGTEIHVSVTLVKTGEELNTVLDFK